MRWYCIECSEELSDDKLPHCHSCLEKSCRKCDNAAFVAIKDGDPSLDRDECDRMCHYCFDNDVNDQFDSDVMRWYLEESGISMHSLRECYSAWKMGNPKQQLPLPKAAFEIIVAMGNAAAAKNIIVSQ